MSQLTIDITGSLYRQLWYVKILRAENEWYEKQMNKAIEIAPEQR